MDKDCSFIVDQGRRLVRTDRPYISGPTAF